MLEIFALVLGDSPGSIFSITAREDTSISTWRESVYAKGPSTLERCEPADLTIWKLNQPIPDEEVSLVAGQPLSEIASIMLPSRKLSQYFPSALKGGVVHVIVVPNLSSAGEKHGRPSEDDAGGKPGAKRKKQSLEESEDNDQLYPLPKKPRTQGKVDVSQELVKRWSKPIAAPSISILRAHLQLPLTEEEKVPISQNAFNDLVTPFSVNNPALTLPADTLGTLFRVSTEQSAKKIRNSFRQIIDNTPPTNGTGATFHHTWDANISDVLHLVLSTKDSIRNSNRNTSAALKSPNYGLLVNNNCVFRGEETGPNSTEDPRAELIQKLIYTYDPLEYILGYYAVGTQVNFVAITRPPSTTEPLFNHDLEYTEHRVANMVLLIRLCGVISWMGQQLHARNIREFVPFFRPDGLTRITIGAVVKKEFEHPDGIARVLNLVKIYRLLKEKRVPNVDALHEHSTEPPYVMVTPVAMDQAPRSGFAAFNAVVCVLQALKVMHSGPSPVYHRDIREPNILKKRDGDDWFLIDWSDASTTPTLAVTHMSESEHSPRVRMDNHGAEVDIWGVGYYLKCLASGNQCADAYNVNEMAKKWIADQTITAEVALNEISNSRHLFFTPAA